MKKSKKITIISVIVIAVIMGLLQIYHYCLNLSVELPQEVDQAVTECLETMVDPDEYMKTIVPSHFDLITSAYHPFGYTEDDAYIKVYGYCAVLRFTNETLKENKDNRDNHIDMYSSESGEANYFGAYLKKDEQQKVIPEKIWIYQYPQTTMDILKHMPIRTWLYIFLDDPKGYMEKLSTKCAKQMYEYIDSHDIPESNEEK